MAYSDFTAKAGYKTGFAGAHVVLEVLNGSDNVIARGMGASFNDSIQVLPVQELGKRKVEEVVLGAQQPGQLQVQTLMTFEGEDKLPQWNSIFSYKNMTASLKVVGDYDDVDLKGKVLVQFKGVHFQNTSGNVTPQGNIMRNVTMMYTHAIRPEQIPSNYGDTSV